MSLERIFGEIVKITNLSTTEVVISMIVLAIFVWLYKEFKNQYQKNMEQKIAKTEKLMTNLSKSLSVAYRYNYDTSKAEEFFETVFECFPLLETFDIEEIEKVMNGSSMHDKEKIEKISKKLYQHLVKLCEQNNDFNSIKSPIKRLEYILDKVKDIVMPLGQTVYTLFIVICIFPLLIIGDNFILNIIRFTAVLLLIVISIGIIDLYKKDRLKRNGIIFIILILVSLILLIFQFNLVIVYISIVVLVISFISLFRMA